MPASERRASRALTGTITSIGTASGDRFVVGAWQTSPIGPFADVMWAKPDGHRRLLVPSKAAGDFVKSIYEFDSSLVVPFRVRATPTSLDVGAGPISIEAFAAGGGRIPFSRPLWFTRFVEGPIARRVMGVRTHGVSPLGVEEWYQARGWRWIRKATVKIDHQSVAWGSPAPALNVGFSEPPDRAAITDVTVALRPVPALGGSAGSAHPNLDIPEGSS